MRWVRQGSGSLRSVREEFCRLTNDDGIEQAVPVAVVVQQLQLLGLLRQVDRPDERHCPRKAVAAGQLMGCPSLFERAGEAYQRAQYAVEPGQVLGGLGLKVRGQCLCVGGEGGWRATPPECLLDEPPFGTRQNLKDLCRLIEVIHLVFLPNILQVATRIMYEYIYLSIGMTERTLTEQLWLLLDHVGCPRLCSPLNSVLHGGNRLVASFGQSVRPRGHQPAVEFLPEARPSR